MTSQSTQSKKLWERALASLARCFFASSGRVARQPPGSMRVAFERMFLHLQLHLRALSLLSRKIFPTKGACFLLQSAHKLGKRIRSHSMKQRSLSSQRNAKGTFLTVRSKTASNQEKRREKKHAKRRRRNELPSRRKGKLRTKGSQLPRYLFPKKNTTLQFTLRITRPFQNQFNPSGLQKTFLPSALAKPLVKLIKTPRSPFSET